MTAFELVFGLTGLAAILYSCWWVFDFICRTEDGYHVRPRGCKCNQYIEKGVIKGVCPVCTKIHEKNQKEIDGYIESIAKYFYKRSGKIHDFDKKDIYIATRLWNICGYASIESVKYIINYTIFKKKKKEFKDTLKHVEEAIEYRDYGINDNYYENT